MKTKINNLTWIITVLALTGVVLAGCGDSSTGPDTNGNGDNGGDDDPPTAPTFANVQDIFTGSCGGSGCHIGESQSGVQLDSYEAIMNSVGAQYGTNVVIPDSADASPLVDKIEENPQIGARMPQGGPYLSQERINLIKEWIDNGAQDDSN